FAQRAAADNRLFPRICPSRSTHVLRSKLLGSVPACRRTRRQNSARDEARRYSSRAADEVRACHQSHHREGPRSYDTSAASCARRRGDRMRRREFITLFGGVAAAWPSAARAQQAVKSPRIGILSPSRSQDASPNRVTLKAFVAGLRELGYAEGQNITIEREFAEANADQLREAAAALVNRKVDVIVTLSTTAARPAKQATTVIPIVAIGMADPVDDELVASLARP